MADKAALTGNAGARRNVLTFQRLVDGLLFLAIASSFVVSIEPAPYDVILLPLTVVALCSGVRIYPIYAPLIALFAIWAFGGAISATNAASDTSAITYYFISIYMGWAALLFALILGEDTERRVVILRRAYVLAAFIGSVIGVVTFFNVFPSLQPLFWRTDRATGFFKDPNVFGPFLILPLLLLIQRFFCRDMKAWDYIALLGILLGLFLSFSRGAWGHFVASALVMLTCMFVTAPDRAFRLRLIVASLVALGVLVVLLMVLLSFGTITEMMSQRANLVNYYDGGEGGRFDNQFKGMLAIFGLPNGLGPKQFAKEYGLDPHNVYLASLYAYGWLGGVAYFGMVFTTLVVGFRALMIRTPWQLPLIAAVSTYLGVALEGFIIDTDHWRHYFLIMGMVWGLAAASFRQRMLARR
ncbi:O-antigen ligase domain-containing protein [Ancylobacter terrae]|uniref:O-antigen ligase domain-containing protein n=1 Tax=Ancylobacter sp. sgz301288 TaxID=3342077 RepID=UPI0038590EDC